MILEMKSRKGTIVFCSYCGAALNGGSVCANCGKPVAALSGKPRISGNESFSRERKGNESDLVFSLDGGNPSARLGRVIGIVLCIILGILFLVASISSFEEMSYWDSDLEKAMPWFALVGVVVAFVCAGIYAMDFRAISRAYIRIYRDHVEMMAIPASYTYMDAKAYHPADLNIGLEQIQGVTAKGNALQIVIGGKAVKAYCPSQQMALKASGVLNEQMRAYRLQK